jgi:hypothetical protein
LVLPHPDCHGPAACPVALRERRTLAQVDARGSTTSIVELPAGS